MTSSHIFFIPLVLLVGLVLGIVLGRRSAFLQIEEERKRQKREAERKARDEAAGRDTAATPPAR